jgi:protein-S-isoprenylcysteine O-methyltransferase Ste14
MDTARYVIAVMMVVALPPALLLWFFIHPAAAFWRKLGAGWTYAILCPPMVALMVWAYFERRLLVGTDLGTELLVVCVGIVTFGVSVWIGVKRGRLLTFATLVGVPEVSRDGAPGKLLTEGIYGRIRHPRYAEVATGVLAYAIFANYTGLYALAVLTFPVLWLIVVLEERELRQRFGDEYVEYCERVPRFFPRLRSRTEPGSSPGASDRMHEGGS